MIDTKKAKWELSSQEKYAIKWFEKHGYDVLLEKQYISKTVFTVTKDCIVSRFELPQGKKNINIKSIMEQFEKMRELELKLLGF